MTQNDRNVVVPPGIARIPDEEVRLLLDGTTGREPLLDDEIPDHVR